MSYTPMDIKAKSQGKRKLAINEDILTNINWIEESLDTVH